MARWKPDSCERLQGAALELFSEQGFEHTTVGEIAARVGVTTRTFFRHFADKREVLFAGGEELEASLTERIIQAPAHADRPRRDRRVPGRGLGVKARELQSRFRP